ncbi:Tn3 family transposase [Nocardia sp. NPDC049220]|uniref:Tn3 family transposase n=1 Tax=Nocardia sp. NPDC049220 TaxID=3155273 RepID=UPI0033FF4E2D
MCSSLPLAEEIAWARERTGGPEALFALALDRKCFQKMARFCARQEIAEVVIDHAARDRAEVDPDHGKDPRGRYCMAVFTGGSTIGPYEAAEFMLATLFGFDLMPRIGSFADLTFFRANEHVVYPHIDALFGARTAAAGGGGRNVIDWKLIERHWRDPMQVAVSIGEGRLSSSTLMRRLRSNSRKNRIYQLFREVGRSVRTVALLRHLADPTLRVCVTAATSKVESYYGFAQWLSFGNNGVLADNDPVEQEKLIKFNTLLANLVIFHNALEITDVVRRLVAEGWTITADQLAALSPYPRAHISRFGAYATNELTHQPDPFDPALTEVHFTTFDLAA